MLLFKDLKEIKAAFKYVRDVSTSDNEDAHCTEDTVYISILAYIAAGNCKTKVEMQKAAALGAELPKLE